MLVAFSSNYALSAKNHEQLRRCPMFSSLLSVHVRPVEGEERRQLAADLLRRRLAELMPERTPSLSPDALAIEMRMQLGKEDVRPLVRDLRAIAGAYDQQPVPSLAFVLSTLALSVLLLPQLLAPSPLFALCLLFPLLLLSLIWVLIAFHNEHTHKLLFD